jgi:hypothetical protein
LRQAERHLRQAELFRWVGGFVVGVAPCGIQATEKIRLPLGVRRLMGIQIFGKPNVYLRQAELFRWVGEFVVGDALCGIRATEKIRLPLGVRRLMERYLRLKQGVVGQSKSESRSDGMR